MRLLSERSRRRALTVVAAVSLTCGLALAPQTALADDEVSQETIEQEGSIATENDEQDVVATVPSTEEVVASESASADETPVVDQTTTVDEGTTTDVVTDDSTTDAASGEQSPASGEELIEEGNTPSEDPTTEVVDQPAEDVVEDAATNGDEATVVEEEAAAPEEVAPKTEESSATQAVATQAAPAKKASTSSTTAKLTAQAPGDHQIIKDGTYVIESGIVAEDKLGLAKLVLDARGGAKNGAEVITWTYGGKDNQKWIVLRDGESDWYTIASYANSKLVLTATNNKGKLYLTNYVSGLASQLWAFVLSGKSYGTGYQLVPKGVQKSVSDTTIVSTEPNKALDVRGGKPVNGSEVITYTKSDTVKPNQSVYLVDPTPIVSAGLKNMEGKYRFYVPGTKVVLEVRKASTENRANIWTWESNGKSHQDVYLQYEGNGFYSVWIMGTKKVLDVQGSSILYGTNVIQWAYSGKTNQQWAVRKNADGTYSLINRATGLVLGGASEKNGKYGNGTNLVGAQDNGRANNAFTLKRSPLVSAGIYKLIKTSNGRALDVSKASTLSGANISFYKDNGKMNQRFELISAGETDLWRIRTASSGGWITLNSSNKIVQQGNHATAQSDANTWRILWRNGEYQFRNSTHNRYIGTIEAKFKVTKSPITVSNGVYEIDSKAAKVALDNPKGSKTSGTKINVYTDNDGANQKWLIEKYGSGYKITNLTSGYVLTASGSSVIQSKFNGSASQVWTLGIADGGAVRLINQSTKKVLDIWGNSAVSSGKSTGTQTYESTGDRESRQGWKLIATSAWYKVNGHWRYASRDSRAHFDWNIKENGESTGNYDILHELWEKVQKKTSKTKYLIAHAWDACYIGVFQGRWGNWEPLYGWNCTNMSREIVNEYYHGSAPTYSYLLALGNNKKYILEDDVDGWVWGLDTTWKGSRRRMINPSEQYFTSIEFWLGYHTWLGSKNELGKHLSHGCMRLDYPNAKWIYDNVAPGTRCVQLRSNIRV